MRKAIQVDKEAHNLLVYLANATDTSINEIVVMLTLNYSMQFMGEHNASENMIKLVKELAAHYADKSFYKRKGEQQ